MTNLDQLRDQGSDGTRRCECGKRLDITDSCPNCDYDYCILCGKRIRVNESFQGCCKECFYDPEDE